MQSVLYSYNGKLLSNKKENAAVTCSNMDGDLPDIRLSEKSHQKIYNVEFCLYEA